MTGVISPSLGLSPQRPFPDDCLAKFKPERELASGGYGAVYLARQESLDRPVAIKLLLGHVLKDAAQIQRFVAEARITASIRHPHVVTVIDHGAEYRVPWIAYEYLPGPSLRAGLSNGPLPLREAVRAAQQIAEALDAAHALEVLHRDVKPDNVLAAAPGHYKVADFGIARWIDDARVKTGTGLILGTPAYIAPEQVRGAEASRASDIYALGVTLFELCTGGLPFDADNPLKLLELHVKSEVPLPSARNPHVPPELERLILKALAKTPEARFASARDVADSLASFLATPERPQREGSGRVRRPTGRTATARITLSARAIPDRPPEPRWRRGTMAMAALALAALGTAAALMRPGPAPAPPSATPARPAPAVSASPVDEPSRWLPPLEADLTALQAVEYDPARVARARALLDTIWRRAGERAHLLTEPVLLATAEDLHWWHHWMKRKRAEFFPSRSVTELRAPVAAEYRRARARAEALVEALARRPTTSFAVTARAGIWIVMLSHKDYTDIDAGGRAALIARLRSWTAHGSGSLLASILKAFLSNLDEKGVQDWDSVFAQAEKAVVAEFTRPAVFSWYLLLRAAMMYGGGKSIPHVARVDELEKRVRGRLRPLVDQVQVARDSYEDQRLMAVSGLIEMDM